MFNSVIPVRERDIKSPAYLKLRYILFLIFGFFFALDDINLVT